MYILNISLKLVFFILFKEIGLRKKTELRWNLKSVYRHLKNSLTQLWQVWTGHFKYIYFLTSINYYLKKTIRYNDLLFFKHPELILASYDNSPNNYDELETEAAIALWNVKSDLKSPQQLFTNTVISYYIKFGV